MKKIIIAAVAKNRVIGRTNGEMPWHSKEEFQHFKNTTLGSPVIMGRKTFESLEKPLKGRLNIVLSKNKDFNPPFEELKILGSLQEAYNLCESLNFEKIFVIGGSFIFNEAINSVNEMILSIMDLEAEGDVYFPDFNKDEWDVLSREQRSVFEIIHYVRKN